jgi:HPt (histidine-containing phosphotransfer) domain-containing protein
MASELAAWADATPPEAGRESSSRPVDLVHLSRYTLGDRALEREVLELFCAQSSIYLERLRAAGSDKEWKDAAHSLKGSASAIGAWRVASACERAETFLGDTEGRVPHLRELEVSLQEAEIYIGMLLADN